MKFFAFEVAWAKVAFDTIFPGAHEAGLVSMDAMDVDGFVNETAARIPAKTAFGFRIAIWLATFAPLFGGSSAALARRSFVPFWRATITPSAHSRSS